MWSSHCKPAHAAALLQQRHCQHAAVDPHVVLETVLRILLDICDLHWSAFQNRATLDRLTVEVARRARLAKDSFIRQVQATNGLQIHIFFVGKGRHAEARTAKRHRLLDNDVEHGLHTGRRTPHDFEDLGGGGLPFQRLAGLVEQPHVLDRDHGLRGEGLE